MFSLLLLHILRPYQNKRRIEVRRRRRGRKRRENNKIVEEGIIKTKGYDVIGVNSFLPKKGD